jgi:hypothetical protein
MYLRFNLFTIVILFSLQLFAQQNQTYVGNYTNDDGIVGKATYSYFEKDYVKIKNGNFTYSYYTNGVTRELKGPFINGMRDGLWTSTIAGRGFEVNISGTFSSGLPNGKFSYKAIYNGSPYQTMLVEFKNGVVIGDFVFEDVRKGEKVNGKVTSLGYMDGDWKITEGNNEYIQKYDNGVYTLYLERNVNDGNITRKDDYLIPIQNLKPEDIVVKNTQWELTNTNDVYGIYFQKYLWANWDPTSVGGIKENPINGMFFTRKSSKSKMKNLNLLDEEFYKSIVLNNQDSIKNTFNRLQKSKDKIMEQDKMFESNRNVILSAEVNLRDSTKKLLDVILSYKAKYASKNEDLRALLENTDLTINNIKSVTLSFNEINKLTYNGKPFSGLKHPSQNQFYLDNFIKQREEIKNFRGSMNFQNANDLVTYSPTYDSLILDFRKKFLAIEKQSTSDQKNYFEIYDPKFTSEPKQALQDLSGELKLIKDQKDKFLLLNNGEKINEKLVILQDYYFSSLPPEYSLEKLKAYIIQLKKLNDKMNLLLTSEEAIKTLLKEAKKEVDPQILESIFLK